MSRLTWKHGWRYCAAKTKQGEPCGNKVPKGITYCHAHRTIFSHVPKTQPKELK